MTFILGVHAGTGTYHDPSACLIDGDGTVLAFVEEERLTRTRHAHGVRMPALSVRQCLRLAAVTAEEIDVVAVGWDEPRMSSRAGQPWRFDSPREFLTALGFRGPRWPDLHFVPHHRAHAASAFHASGYDRAAVLVLDGNGEDECTSIYRAQRGGPLVRVASWPQVYSVGHMYEAVSAWLGLGRHGAGRTMGLAAYDAGNVPIDPGWLVPDTDRLISVLGGDPDQDYDMLKSRWHEQVIAFTGVDRPKQPPQSLDTDPVAVHVAGVAQLTVENVVRWLAARARFLTGIDELCIAGGVGLNCATNSRLPGPLYVPPVPHDGGVALSAAWSLAAPTNPAVFSAYTGSHPGALPADLAGVLVCDVDVDRVADLLLDGRIVGVCRGRSEVGPRALCHRSFLASPVSAQMKQTMNMLKRRERWRPFGPVTNADLGTWWSPVGQLDRYMLGAARLTDQGASTLPAIAHIDGTTRPQRLRDADEPFVAAVLDELARRGHPPVLLNTSFNGPGEPLVDTAAEAFDCARRLGADAIVTDSALLLLDPVKTSRR
ncbi:carbamoyltransferase C-terminal domain-containing protein [Frankia sp. Cas4]|uniref:carbamoyltransferase C-terminal domain-containing protein n=1 Tax=Frankia sp. Cas4 TaxID=3073927 RepID=UPI002AD3EDBC|nr:carbamoyltransferase C-terminal domain-containing protein [Frankia sp. Cas4]